LDRGQDPESIVWDLLIEDVQAAADVMRPVFDREHGGDGFVSIEVSPEIAGDTERTIAAARDLQRRTARPNVMVKIPATPAGPPASPTPSWPMRCSPSSTPAPAGTGCAPRERRYSAASGPAPRPRTLATET